MNVKLLYIETCLPCYQNGFSGHVYAIPVDHESTYGSVLEDLLIAIGNDEIYDLPEKAYKEIEEQAKSLFEPEDKESIWDSMIEPSESEDDETIYAYFGVKTN